MTGDAIQPIELALGRFLLRPPRVAEAPDVLRLARDPDVRMWNPRCRIDDEEAAIAHCLTSANWSTGNDVSLSIVDRTSGRYAGNIALHDIDWDTGQASIGYRVAPWSRGLGLATGSVRTLSAWALTTLSLNRIVLTHATGNIASCRVADKAAFVLSQLLPAHKRFGDGQLHDEHLHELTATHVRDFPRA